MKKKISSIIFALILLVGGLKINAELPNDCQSQFCACMVLANTSYELGYIDVGTYNMLAVECNNRYWNCLDRNV